MQVRLSRCCQLPPGCGMQLVKHELIGTASPSPQLVSWGAPAGSVTEC